MFLSLRSHLLLACRSCVSSRCAQAADPREREGMSAGAPAAVEVPVIPDDTRRAPEPGTGGTARGPRPARGTPDSPARATAPSAWRSQGRVRSLLWRKRVCVWTWQRCVCVETRVRGLHMGEQGPLPRSYHESISSQRPPCVRKLRGKRHGSAGAPTRSCRSSAPPLALSAPYALHVFSFFTFGLRETFDGKKKTQF